MRYRAVRRTTVINETCRLPVVYGYETFDSVVFSGRGQVAGADKCVNTAVLGAHVQHVSICHMLALGTSLPSTLQLHSRCALLWWGSIAPGVGLQALSLRCLHHYTS